MAREAIESKLAAILSADAASALLYGSGVLKGTPKYASGT